MNSIRSTSNLIDNWIAEMKLDVVWRSHIIALHGPNHYQEINVEGIHCKFREGAVDKQHEKKHSTAVSLCCSLDEGANVQLIKKFDVLCMFSRATTLITANHEHILELIKWFSDRNLEFW